MSATTSPRRARRALWLLILVASLATGVLTGSLGATPGPLVGLRVAVSGLVIVVALTLAVRVMVALDGARRGATTPAGPHHDEETGRSV